MYRIDKTRVFAAALLASVALAVPARAQSPTAPPEGDDWEFSIAPYLMGAALDGTVSVNGREAEADISASDIFDHLDLGAMGMAAARKGNWGVMSDAVFVKLEVESPKPPADFNPTIGIFQLQGLRKVAPWADVTAGVRWNHLNAVIDMKPPFPPVHVDKSRNWVDPVLGVVLRTPGKGRLHGTLIADIGGFSVGSKLTWQVFPTVGVRLSKHASLEAGYRFLDVDYESGDGASRFAYDMLYQGPVVGFAFRF
jgi:hypothetical protein